MPATCPEVMRAMVAAFDTGDVGEAAAVVHPGYLDHQGLPGERPISGIDGFVHVVETARSGYDDLSVSVVDLIEGSDWAAARIAWHGRLPSGAIVRHETIDIIRVEAGKAVEHWGGRS